VRSDSVATSMSALVKFWSDRENTPIYDCITAGYSRRQ